MPNTDAPRPIDDTDTAWLRDYEERTRNYYGPRFVACEHRFAGGIKLLNHYSALVGRVIDDGRIHFRAAHEAHNEICVADAILGDPSTKDALLLYEPALPNTDKTIEETLNKPRHRVVAAT